MAEVTVNTLVDTQASVAEVNVSLAGGYRGRFVASSKKHPKDFMNNTVGEALALARAMRRAADDMEQWSWNRVKQDQGDWNRLVYDALRSV